MKVGEQDDRQLLQRQASTQSAGLFGSDRAVQCPELRERPPRDPPGPFRGPASRVCNVADDLPEEGWYSLHPVSAPVSLSCIQDAIPRTDLVSGDEGNGACRGSTAFFGLRTRFTLLDTKTADVACSPSQILSSHCTLCKGRMCYLSKMLGSVVSPGSHRVLPTCMCDAMSGIDKELGAFRLLLPDGRGSAALHRRSNQARVAMMPSYTFAS
eukprot:1299111-Rhodomonas_salina.2